MGLMSKRLSVQMNHLEKEDKDFYEKAKLPQNRKITLNYLSYFCFILSVICIVIVLVIYFYLKFLLTI